MTTDSTTETERVRPVDKLIDIKLTLEPPRYTVLQHMTEDQIIRELTDWAKELEAFIRDHRSQDPITISVERVIMKVCSACQCEWEPGEEDEGTVCLGCGREVDPSHQ